MFTSKKAEDNYLSEKTILKRVSEYDIFRYYIGYDFELQEAIPSPLKLKDDRPSFNVYYQQSYDRLMFKDWGNHQGDCIQFVRLIFNLTRWEALQKINIDLDLNLKGYKGRPLEKEKRKFLQSSKKTLKQKKIQVKLQNYTKVDLQYWAQYYIHRPTLKHFNVYSCSKVFKNKIAIFNYTNSEPIYAYYFRANDTIKIYRPFSKVKWLTNCKGLVDLQGYRQLPKKGNLLIITKSMKDVMVLYELGFYSVAPQSEGSEIDEDILIDLKSRFKRIVILFDNDSAGCKTSSEKSDKWGLENICIDKHFLDKYNIKDVSDYIKEFGFEATYNYINELIK